MAVHSDLALSRIEQFPKDRRRLLVVCHRIREQIRRHNMMVVQQELERRHLLNIRDAWDPRRGHTPLIFLRIDGDDDFQLSTSRGF
jgi:hypothetical protein